MWAQMDLVSTVGEVAALGASGVVMWGSSSDYDSQVNASTGTRVEVLVCSSEPCG